MLLGETLVAKGIITRAQLDAALEEQKRLPGERLGAVLIRLGFVSKEQLEAMT